MPLILFVPCPQGPQIRLQVWLVSQPNLWQWDSHPSESSIQVDPQRQLSLGWDFSSSCPRSFLPDFVLPYYYDSCVCFFDRFFMIRLQYFKCSHIELLILTSLIFFTMLSNIFRARRPATLVQISATEETPFGCGSSDSETLCAKQRSCELRTEIVRVPQLATENHQTL